MNPLLSIIVPVYQAENYLEACIDSILSQTFQDFELILVDDGSTDLSGMICDKYATKDIRIKVIHKKNQGQAAARNDALNIATGKYIGFVDNDDIIKPEMFSVLIKNVEQCSADISSCSYQKQTGNKVSYQKDITGKKYVFEGKEGFKEYLSREILDVYVWTKVYKREFLDRFSIRFEAGQIDEDILFNFQAYKFAAKSVCEDIPLYIYNVRNDSESHSYHKKDLKRYIQGTLYRVDKIMEETKADSPELVFLAIRQKIIYFFALLDAIIISEQEEYRPTYDKLLTFLKKNREQIAKEYHTVAIYKFVRINKRVLLQLSFLPVSLYYYFHKREFRNTKNNQLT